MKNYVSCTYDHGIDTDKDNKARSLAKEVGGVLVGSGCWLDAQAQRDLEFEVKTAVDANKLMKALRKAGFENVSSYRD